MTENYQYQTTISIQDNGDVHIICPKNMPTQHIIRIQMQMNADDELLESNGGNKIVVVKDLVRN